MLAASTVAEATRIVVVLQIGLSSLGILFALAGSLHQQAGFLEIVIAARHPSGTGLHAHAETFDHRLVGNQATVLNIGCRLTEARETGLVITEHQHMPFGAVLEVVMDALFRA